MPEESVDDFAKRERISPRRVRALIEQGQLAARKVGSQWLVAESSVHRPAASRPLSPRMQVGLVALLSGSSVPEVSGSAGSRLRIYVEHLRAVHDPDRVLRSWIRERAPLRLIVASSDISDLAHDPRVVKSGFSDPRAEIAAAEQLEARVAEADVESLRREYLMRSSDRPNVLLHVADERPPSPLPLGLLLVDLAHHDGVRERSRVVELLRGFPE